MVTSFLFFGDVTSGYLYKPDAVLYFTCGWVELDEIWFVGFLGTLFNMVTSFLFFGDVTSGYLYKPDAVLYFTCGWAELDAIWFVGVFGDTLQHGDVIFILR